MPHPGAGYATVGHTFDAPTGVDRWDHVLKFLVVVSDDQPSPYDGVDLVPVTVVVRLMGDVNGDGIVTRGRRDVGPERVGCTARRCQLESLGGSGQVRRDYVGDLQLVSDNMGRSLVP